MRPDPPSRAGPRRAAIDDRRSGRRSRMRASRRSHRPLPRRGRSPEGPRRSRRGDRERPWRASALRRTSLPPSMAREARVSRRKSLIGARRPTRLCRSRFKRAPARASIPPSGLAAAPSGPLTGQALDRDRSGPPQARQSDEPHKLMGRKPSLLGLSGLKAQGTGSKIAPAADSIDRVRSGLCRALLACDLAPGRSVLSGFRLRTLWMAGAKTHAIRSGHKIVFPFYAD